MIPCGVSVVLLVYNPKHNLRSKIHLIHHLSHEKSFKLYCLPPYYGLQQFLFCLCWLTARIPGTLPLQTVNQGGSEKHPVEIFITLSACSRIIRQTGTCWTSLFQSTTSAQRTPQSTFNGETQIWKMKLTFINTGWKSSLFILGNMLVCHQSLKGDQCHFMCPKESHDLIGLTTFYPAQHKLEAGASC